MVFVEPAAGLTELVDSGNQHFAHILPEEQLLLLLSGGHAYHVRHVSSVEGGADLSIEVNTVHPGYYHRRITELRVQSQLLRCKRLSRNDLPLPWKCQMRPFFG